MRIRGKGKSWVGLHTSPCTHAHTHSRARAHTCSWVCVYFSIRVQNNNDIDNNKGNSNYSSGNNDYNYSNNDLIMIITKTMMIMAVITVVISILQNLRISIFANDTKIAMQT